MSQTAWTIEDLAREREIMVGVAVAADALASQWQPDLAARTPPPVAKPVRPVPPIASAQSRSAAPPPPRPAAVAANPFRFAEAFGTALGAAVGAPRTMLLTIGAPAVGIGVLLSARQRGALGDPQTMVTVSWVLLFIAGIALFEDQVRRRLKGGDPDSNLLAYLPLSRSRWQALWRLSLLGLVAYAIVQWPRLIFGYLAFYPSLVTSALLAIPAGWVMFRGVSLIAGDGRSFKAAMTLPLRRPVTFALGLVVIEALRLTANYWALQALLPTWQWLAFNPAAAASAGLRLCSVAGFAAFMAYAYKKWT